MFSLQIIVQTLLCFGEIAMTTRGNEHYYSRVQLYRVMSNLSGSRKTFLNSDGFMYSVSHVSLNMSHVIVAVHNSVGASLAIALRDTSLL